MTRRSRREIRRAVDDLDTGGADSRPTPREVTDAHREAIRAVLTYRYDHYDTVAGTTDGDLLEEVREAGDEWGDMVHQWEREILEK